MTLVSELVQAIASYAYNASIGNTARELALQEGIDISADPVGVFELWDELNRAQFDRRVAAIKRRREEATA